LVFYYYNIISTYISIQIHKVELYWHLKRRLKVTQKFKKHRTRNALIWGMQGKSNIKKHFRFTWEFLSQTILIGAILWFNSFVLLDLKDNVRGLLYTLISNIRSDQIHCVTQEPVLKEV